VDGCGFDVDVGELRDGLHVLRCGGSGGGSLTHSVQSIGDAGERVSVFCRGPYYRAELRGCAM
jgi:hypothetical protein